MGLCWCRRTSMEATNMGTSEDVEIPTRAPSCDRGKSIEEYVLEMIKVVGTEMYNIYDEQPGALLELHFKAESDAGWIEVVGTLIQTIPLHEPLGPTTIAVIFDDCPLPATRTVLELLHSYGLGERRARDSYDSDVSDPFHRNLLVLLGCMAERFAGSVGTSIINCGVLDYLYVFLTNHTNPEKIIFTLVVLEKFSKTMVTKGIIVEYLSDKETKNPLLQLERYHNSKDLLWRQVGFFSRWLLDNMFMVEGRPLSYLSVDMTNTNVILDQQSASDTLKISPDGLEARSDSQSFESVRCSFSVDRGCWYYEVEILTSGVMQIGWCTADAKLNVDEGHGIGDDSFSIAYDGCRRNIWYGAVPDFLSEMEPWKPGDILGCLIDVANKEAVFYLNGNTIDVCGDIFRNSSDKFYAAASFMSFQSAKFNFGKDEFKFAPKDREFMHFNDVGVLPQEKKQVVPRWMLKQQMQTASADKAQPTDNLCVVCYNNQADTIFAPCLHWDVCKECAERMRYCPLCREPVWHYVALPLCDPATARARRAASEASAASALAHFDADTSANPPYRVAASFLDGLAALMNLPSGILISDKYRVFHMHEDVRPAFRGETVQPVDKFASYTHGRRPKCYEIIREDDKSQYETAVAADTATPAALLKLEDFIARRDKRPPPVPFVRPVPPIFQEPEW